MNGKSDRDPEGGPRLEDIDARLKALRGRREAEKRGRPTGSGWQGTEFAWRMVADLTAGVAVGSVIGWGLDWLFGTAPLFLLAFVLLGFAAGVRVMMQSAEQLRRRNRAEAEKARAGEDGAGAGAPQDEER